MLTPNTLKQTCNASGTQRLSAETAMAPYSDDSFPSLALPESVLRSLCLGGMGTWHLSMVDGVPILTLSSCFPSLLGYPAAHRKAPLQTFLEEWVHPDDRRLLTHAFDYLIPPDPQTADEELEGILSARISGAGPDIAPPVFRVRAADGSWRFTRLLGSLDRPDTPPAYQGIIQLVEEPPHFEERAVFSRPRSDVSGTAESSLFRTVSAEQTPLKNENVSLSLEQYFKGMPSAMFALSTDGTILEWSRDAELTLPLDHAARGTTSFVSLILEEDRPNAAMAMASALDFGASGIGIRAVRRDGHVGMFSLQCRAMETGDTTVLALLLFGLN